MKYRKNYRHRARSYFGTTSAQTAELREQMYFLSGKALASGNAAAVDSITKAFSVSIIPTIK